MRKSCLVAAGVATLMICASLNAQNYPNGLKEDSARPASDAAFIAKSQERMEQIRKTQKRPTVGLVLSGGGAKGAAEVGAIKYLEELGIPIDLVCGTSIGGLVSGLYAMGYNSDDLTDLFRNQNWSIILSDNVDNKNIPCSIKEYNSKVLYSLNIGKDQHLSTESTIPSGYIYGFNVNNLFSSLAVGYEGNISFAEDLPIPFACVAADVVSCKAYNMVDGSITDALRSTMSIPGLFAPVQKDSYTLVDGGVRNNFPADMAKAMGADIIIGIDLHADKSDTKSINHIGTMLNQLIFMLNKEVYDTNIYLADVLIRPDLEGYGMLSFNPEAVDKLILSGYKAAQSKERELLEVRAKVGRISNDPRIEGKATDISKVGVPIKSIVFEGLTDEESLNMVRLINMDIRQAVNKEIIDNVMGTLQASGYFAEVKYSLRGAEAPYDLVFDCKLAPVHKFGVGLRGDTVEGLSAYANLGLNTNKLIGSMLEIDTKLSHNFKARAKYTYASAHFPNINVEASFNNYNLRVGIPGIVGLMNMHYQSHTEAIYLGGGGRWKKYDIKVGVQNYGSKFLTASFLDLLMNNSMREDLLGVFVDGNYYTLNDHYYPTAGSNIKVEFRYDFARLSENTPFSPMPRLYFRYNTVIGVGKTFSLIPTIQAVWNDIDIQNYGEEESLSNLPLHSMNYIGGSIDKRYHRNHIAFFGMGKSYLAQNCLLTGEIELRHNPIDKLYFSLLGGYIHEANDINSIFGQDSMNIYALGTKLSYKSIIGPITGEVHWNSESGWGATLSVGYNF